MGSLDLIRPLTHAPGSDYGYHGPIPEGSSHGSAAGAGAEARFCLEWGAARLFHGAVHGLGHWVGGHALLARYYTQILPLSSPIAAMWVAPGHAAGAGLGAAGGSHLAGRRQAAFDTDGRQGCVWAGWGVPWGLWTRSNPNSCTRIRVLLPWTTHPSG